MKLHHTLLATAAALLLAACGDSPRDEVAAPMAASDEVPASASASPSAYTQFAASLDNSETRSPLQVNKVKPPTSETEAPLML